MDRPMMPIMLLCEGQSDEAFFEELIKVRGLNGCGLFVLNFPTDQAGVSGFGTRLIALSTTSDVDKCRLVVVVADNDDNPTAKFRDVQAEIGKAKYFGIPPNPRAKASPVSHPPSRTIPDIVVLMLPWNDEPGCLESMCFEVGCQVKPELVDCINSFAKCVKVEDWPIAMLSKLKARCMLAPLTRDNPDVSFKWSWSKSKGPSPCPWPVDNKRFDKIAEYLKQLSSEEAEKWPNPESSV
jgi:hypothetical protein